MKNGIPKILGISASIMLNNNDVWKILKSTIHLTVPITGNLDPSAKLTL